MLRAPALPESVVSNAGSHRAQSLHTDHAASFLYQNQSVFGFIVHQVFNALLATEMEFNPKTFIIGID